MVLPRMSPAQSLLVLCAVMLAVVSTASTLASAATVTTTMVSLDGMVDGPPESIVFSGELQIDAKAVESAEFEAPTSVELVVDLRRVVGVGSATGKRYVSSTQDILTRQLAVADLFEFAFTFFPAGEAGAVRVGLLLFNLGFDMTTGQIIGAKAEVVSPDFPGIDERAGATDDDGPVSSSENLR